MYNITDSLFFVNFISKISFSIKLSVSVELVLLNVDDCPKCKRKGISFGRSLKVLKFLLKVASFILRVLSVFKLLG